MKYTDLAILFSIIFLCNNIETDYKLNLLREAQRQEIMYNSIFDTATQDALRNSLKIEKEEATLDEELVFQQFFKSIQYLMDLNISNFPFVLISDSKKITIWSNGEKKYIFLSEGDKIQRVETIRKEIESTLNSSMAGVTNSLKHTISIPYIDMEEWYNTVGELGIFVVFQAKPMDFRTDNYRYIVSGAAFQKVEEKPLDLFKK